MTARETSDSCANGTSSQSAFSGQTTCQAGSLDHQSFESERIEVPQEDVPQSAFRCAMDFWRAKEQRSQSDPIDYIHAAGRERLFFDVNDVDLSLDGGKRQFSAESNTTIGSTGTAASNSTVASWEASLSPRTLEDVSEVDVLSSDDGMPPMLSDDDMPLLVSHSGITKLQRIESQCERSDAFQDASDESCSSLTYGSRWFRKSSSDVFRESSDTCSSQAYDSHRSSGRRSRASQDSSSESSSSRSCSFSSCSKSASDATQQLVDESTDESSDESSGEADTSFEPRDFNSLIQTAVANRRPLTFNDEGEDLNSIENCVCLVHSLRNEVDQPLDGDPSLGALSSDDEMPPLKTPTLAPRHRLGVSCPLSDNSEEIPLEFLRSKLPAPGKFFRPSASGKDQFLLLKSPAPVRRQPAAASVAQAHHKEDIVSEGDSDESGSDYGLPQFTLPGSAPRVRVPKLADVRLLKASSGRQRLLQK